ncbi:MAG: hypothetical protein ACI8XZ_004281, partial [Gammaproteobacteria bacterium]
RKTTYMSSEWRIKNDYLLLELTKHSSGKSACNTNGIYCLSPGYSRY